ncbi:glycoside hydrolase family 125 protein [Aestuariivivens sediminicola]|uniref:glycoside hydrolase family 125 protein n=1 Tax=Aestuariivivens sediminicola TaxID=2913560 RepID=UPI001F563EEA|nr:glycoside hydrolase family 125 protein [Aestuariivivens sediminicola]
MISRRKFVQDSILASTGLTILGSSITGYAYKLQDFKSNRPLPENRTFNSKAVEEIIIKVKQGIRNPELSWLFENCFPNTLDTTVDFEIKDGKPDAFIITGDIDAMWLRDSTAQIWPYLPLVNSDKKLKDLFRGLINRQTQCILLDPYANAFFKDLTRISEWKDDKPRQKPGVHERKWEIDSLCYAIRLAHGYYKETGDQSVFDSQWDKAMRLAVETLRTEQRKNGSTPYYFERVSSNSTVTASFYGKGRPVKPVGLIASSFRPSDDGTLFPFLIPSNLFAVEALAQLSEIYKVVFRDTAFSDTCASFSEEVLEAVNTYAITEHLDYGNIYAYEVDGFGNKVFIDDPNIPSLIAMKYLIDEAYYDKAVYNNTRRYLLSHDNPYYFKGKAGEGQGGPHAGMDTIWPMGIILRAMTSTDDKEIVWCIRQLMNTHNGSGFMHETFHKDDASKYSRDWFAWANTLFGELILKLYNEKPQLLQSI